MLQWFSLSQKPLVNGLLCIVRCYMIYMYWKNWENSSIWEKEKLETVCFLLTETTWITANPLKTPSSKLGTPEIYNSNAWTLRVPGEARKMTSETDGWCGQGKCFNIKIIHVSHIQCTSSCWTSNIRMQEPFRRHSCPRDGKRVRNCVFFHYFCSGFVGVCF